MSKGKDPHRVSRREFLENSGKAALGIGLGVLAAEGLAAPAAARQKTVSPNSKLRVGAIGTGGMGLVNLKGFLAHSDVEVVAVCDVDSGHLEQAVSTVENKYERKPAAFKDYRKIIEMKDVDAVIISTPDHWHALPFIDACEAGMDVFCEKPLSHDITEAKSMLMAAKKYGTVVQINTWQRSVGFFRDAIDFVRSGKMGRIKVCRSWTMGSRCTGFKPVSQPPQELDYDFWLGPAPAVPYKSNRCHHNWRWYYDYGGGLATDWGVHLIDIVMLGMNSWHPTKVFASGRRDWCAPDDDATVPQPMLAQYEFPEFIMTWEIRPYGQAPDQGREHGSEFIGENGTLIVDREGITWRPNGEHAGPEQKDPGQDHIRDFINCISSRKKPVSDVETMYCTTTACHLMNVSYQLGRSVQWDGKKGEPIGDKRAMEVDAFRRKYRKPWKLPVYPFSIDI